MTTAAQQDPIVIVGQARTPMGGFMGDLASVKATELGSTAIRAAVTRAGLEASDIDEVIMGCVLPAGLGQAPARQASLGAGIPKSTGTTTINKVCGSGMKAIMLAHDLLLAGSATVAVAGGMESMSNAPHLLPGARRQIQLRSRSAGCLCHWLVKEGPSGYRKRRLCKRNRASRDRPAQRYRNHRHRRTTYESALR